MVGDSLGDLFVRVGFDPSGLAAGASAVESQLERTGSRLFFMGSRIAAGFSAPLAGAIGMIAKFGIEFDKAMTESVAIMDGVTPKIRTAMEDQAKAIVNSTKFSATEGAKAYYSLASAGLDAQQSMAALPVVAKFAQASVMDLGKATDFLAGTTAALGLKSADAATNMAGMKRVADVLVEVNNKALGTVTDFSQALERSGPMLRMFGKSVEEGGAVLGVYAEQGIKGARAGQQLYMVLRDLADAATKHKEKWDAAFGPNSVFDKNGAMRNMADIVDTITKKLGPMSTEAKTAELQFLGLQSRARLAILPLVDMGGAIRDLQTGLEGAGGASEHVANEQMKSLANQLQQVYHQFQNLGLELFGAWKPIIDDYIIPGMKNLILYSKELVTWFTNLSEPTKLWILGIAGGLIVLGPFISILGSWILALRALSSPLELLVKLLFSSSEAGGKTTQMMLDFGKESATTVTMTGRVAAGMDAMALAAKGVVTWFAAVKAAGIDASISAITGWVVKATAATVEFAAAWGPVGIAIALAYGVWWKWFTEAGQKAPQFGDWMWRPQMEAADQKNKDKVAGLMSNITPSWKAPSMFAPGADPRAIDNGSGLATSMAAAFATGPLGPGDQGPPKKTAAEKSFDSLIDRLSGTTALNAAKQWMDAIDQIGGTWNLTDKDAKAAESTFEEALAYVEKLGIGATATGVRLQSMWDELHPQLKATPFGGNTGILKADSEGVNAALIADTVGTLETRNLLHSNYANIIKDTQDGSRKIATAMQFVGLDKGLKAISQTTTLLGGMSHEFDALAKDVGLKTPLGQFFTYIGNVTGQMRTAGEGAKELKAGFDQLGTSASGNAAAIINMGVGILKASSAMAAGLDQAQQSKRIMSSTMTGAEIGGQIMPGWGTVIGMGIGAMIGALSEDPHWAVAARKVGQLFGVAISEDMARAIAATADNLSQRYHSAGSPFMGTNTSEGYIEGVANQAAAILHLNDIIKAAGGVSAMNFKQLAGQMLSGFDLVRQGLLTTDEQAYVLDKSFGAFLEHGVDNLGFLNSQLKETIRLADHLGVNSQAIADYLKGQGSTQNTGFINTVAGFQGNFGSSDEGRADNLSGLGRQATVSFAAAVASGTPLTTVLKNMKPAVDALAKGWKDMGKDIGDAGLKALLFESDLVNNNTELVDGIGGLADSMVGLSNMGLLNTSILQDMEKTGETMYNRLLSKSIEMGGGAKEALLPMQDYLHKAKEAADLLGVPLDDATQAMIDDSKNMGIWSDKGQTAMDKLIDKVTDLVNTLLGIPHTIDINGNVHWNDGGYHPPTPPAGPGGTGGTGTTGGGGTNDSGDPTRDRYDEYGNLLMASGGVATGRTRATIGEAGLETVLPLDRAPAILSGAMRMALGDQGTSSPEVVTRLEEIRDAILATKSTQVSINGRNIATATVQALENEGAIRTRAREVLGVE